MAEKNIQKLRLNIDSRSSVVEGPILMTPGGTLVEHEKVNKSVFLDSMSLRNSAETVHTTNKGVKSIDSVDDSEYSKRSLFGGAITLVLPNSFEDVSVIRQVPDHQEVYVDKLSDMSMIVEIFSYDETIPNERAALHYFDDLAQCNLAQDIKIHSHEIISDPAFVPCIRQTFPKCAVIGSQAISKFAREQEGANTAPPDIVQIWLVLLRLASVGTDLLITLNSPNTKTAGMEAATIPPEQVMKRALNSFTIINWALFA